MKATILQPGYLPWLGFFNQMEISDIFVFLDDVQYDRRGWRNRNRIKGCNGPIWLTVPVVQKGQFNQSLLETKVNNSAPWAKKQLRTIQFNYKSSPYFEKYYPPLEEILKCNWESLLDLDYKLTHELMKWMGITTPTYRSSELEVRDYDKTGRLVDICLQVGVSAYISGPLCKDYMDVSNFEKAGIDVLIHDYHHPEYTQRYPPFVSHLSVLDLLFNEGPESLRILTDQTSLNRLPADSAD